MLFILTYGGVLWKGLRPFLFSCRTSEWHPYGSFSNGAAAFLSSPSVERFRSNPVDTGGLTPTYAKRSAGHRKVGACSVSNRRCLKENETTVIFFGYSPVTSLNLAMENILSVHQIFRERKEKRNWYRISPSRETMRINIIFKTSPFLRDSTQVFHAYVQVLE